MTTDDRIAAALERIAAALETQPLTIVINRVIDQQQADQLKARAQTQAGNRPVILVVTNPAEDQPPRPAGKQPPEFYGVLR